MVWREIVAGGNYEVQTVSKDRVVSGMKIEIQENKTACGNEHHQQAVKKHALNHVLDYVECVEELRALREVSDSRVPYGTFATNVSQRRRPYT